MGKQKYRLRYVDELSNEEETTLAGITATLEYITLLYANKCLLLDIHKIK